MEKKAKGQVTTNKGGNDSVLKMECTFTVKDAQGNVISRVTKTGDINDGDDDDILTIEGVSRSISRLADPMIRTSRDAVKESVENVTAAKAKKNGSR